MQSLINDPTLSDYHETYTEGQPIFVEGDVSKDIYVLVHGSLKLLKNKKQIGEIYKSGELLGEMSYLLDTKRTASVVAQTKVRVIRIPEDKIDKFIVDHPDISKKIINTLAQRLKDTTQVAHGLKEFCDQLPDAVVMTDTENKIMAWNKAAEILHGRAWQEMRGQSVSEVFQNPEEYRQFIEDVSAGHDLKEKILLVRHPDGEMRYVSTSTTIIYDGHFNIGGYIFLSRNVTNLKNLEAKYRRIKNIFIPSFVITSILIALITLGLSNFSAGISLLGHKKQSFKERISTDYVFLSNKIQNLADQKDSQETTRLFSQYFTSSQPRQFAITGLILLDNNKKVIAAFSPGSKDNNRDLIGTNYSGINFAGPKDSKYKFLTLYRSEADNPMGRKATELAVKMTSDKTGMANWLVFQLNNEYLDKEFGITAKALTKIDFDKN